MSEWSQIRRGRVANTLGLDFGGRDGAELTRSHAGGPSLSIWAHRKNPRTACIIVLTEDGLKPWSPRWRIYTALRDLAGCRPAGRAGCSRTRRTSGAAGRRTTCACGPSTGPGRGQPPAGPTSSRQAGAAAGRWSTWHAPDDLVSMPQRWIRRTHSEPCLTLGRRPAPLAAEWRRASGARVAAFHQERPPAHEWSRVFAWLRREFKRHDQEHQPGSPDALV
jgi:hypothetical protein